MAGRRRDFRAALALDRGWLGVGDAIGAAGLVPVAAVVCVVMAVFLEELMSRGVWGLSGLGLGDMAGSGLDGRFAGGLQLEHQQADFVVGLA